jgi:predicted transcriptional regulator
LKRGARLLQNFPNCQNDLFHEDCLPTVFLESISLKYRDRLDIIADILDVAGHNAKKTQIMYQANLSYAILQKYLSEIVAASFIAFEFDSQRYLLTPKGQRFLRAYKEYSKNNKTVEKRLNDVAAKRKVLEEMCSRNTNVISSSQS